MGSNMSNQTSNSSLSRREVSGSSAITLRLETPDPRTEGHQRAFQCLRPQNHTQRRWLHVYALDHACWITGSQAMPGIEHREKAMSWCLVVDGHQYADVLLVRLGPTCYFAQPLHHSGVTVVEEAAGSGVQRPDRRHIFLAQIKIEDAEVLHDSFQANRFGNCYDPSLSQPAQNDLPHSFLILARNGTQHLVLKNVVFAFCKRSPGFDLHMVFLQKCLGVNLLIEWMGFHLVDSRNHLVMDHQVHQPVG